MAMKPAILTVLVLIFLSPPAVSQVPDEKLIVPGERIGKWTFQMTIGDLLRLNGPYDQAANPRRVLARPTWVPGLWLHSWDHLGIRVWTLGRDSQRIETLVAITPDFKTTKGVSVGATREAVEMAYGKATRSRPPGPGFLEIIYDEIGLNIELNPDNIVEVVRIFRPGEASKIFTF
jgi:hypothetical protein